MERVVSTDRIVTSDVVKGVDSDERLWPIIRQLLKTGPVSKNNSVYALRATMPPVKNLTSGPETDALCLTPKQEFLKAHNFDVKEILSQTGLHDTTQQLINVWRNGVKEFMSNAVRESTRIEFTLIRYFKHARIEVAETKAGNGLGTLRRVKAKEKRHFQLPLKSPEKLNDHDTLLMWHFSRLVKALELDLHLSTSTEEKLSLFSREKPTGCPAAVKEQAIVMAVVFVIAAIYLQL